MLSNKVKQILLLAIGLVFWEAISGRIYGGFKLVDPLFISSPSLILLDIIEWAAKGTLIVDLMATLEEAFLGLILGIVTGMAIGLLFAYSEGLATLLEPFLAALNTLPRPALAPLFVIWLGLGIPSKVLLSWSLVFFAVFYNTYLGAKNIDPDLIDSVRSMGATSLQVFRIVVIPSTLSWVFAALRVSVSYALIGAVIGEFVGATAGVGYRMMIAEGLLDTDRIFSGLVVLGLVGSSLVQIAGMIEKRLLRWRPPLSLG